MISPTPRVRRGIGPLGSGELQQVLDASRFVAQWQNRVQLEWDAQGAADTSTFFGLITESNQLTDNRWTYTVKRVFLNDPTQAAGQHPNPTTSDNAWNQTESAFNLCEWLSASDQHGDGSDPSTLPAGITLAPITGVVLCRATMCADSENIVWVFERANGVTGECE